MRLSSRLLSISTRLESLTRRLTCREQDIAAIGIGYINHHVRTLYSVE